MLPGRSPIRHNHCWDVRLYSVDDRFGTMGTVSNEGGQESDVGEATRRIVVSYAADAVVTMPPT